MKKAFVGTAVAILALLLFGEASSTKLFNANRAYKGLYYSGAAYCNYEDLAYWTCGEACNYNTLTDIWRIWNPARSNFAFAGFDASLDEIVLSFRGTNGADIENWITNIQAASTSYPGSNGGEAHVGFYKSYNDMKGKVNEVVTDLIKKHPGKGIFVVGHSLGGALATLAALDIVRT